MMVYRTNRDRKLVLATTFAEVFGRSNEIREDVPSTVLRHARCSAFFSNDAASQFSHSPDFAVMKRQRRYIAHPRSWPLGILRLQV